ncbi:disease resistance protein RPV1 isoform X1 [Eucalyptus grandis]|uniref:disease resistance protein RPV1 isoform X1 n=1 Tax=Eucalyptus grandis TaxID=71139 RepID=UPI00192E76DB|nr:disease resistance protein RPV1 isoform X1 [Eucalyptus grandis]XP_039163443.1 disease resistance protein RPV1 isoform X1 [Eucalyptus grandis]
MDCTSLGLLFSNFSPFSLTDLLWNLHQDQQNYASSRCCLGELLEMMECKISRGHLVLPILYKVEPEDVELLLVMLAKRFCLREKHVDEKVEDQWEEVLIEIRSLKGWDSKKDVNRYEGELVKLVIMKVLSTLKKAFRLVFTVHVVRINSPIENVMIVVHRNSSATLIGNYGMGGIGKIVFAEVINNKLADQCGTN